jgi:FtsP/CotA-like multicopper oxidase with cupredoxin domain
MKNTISKNQLFLAPMVAMAFAAAAYGAAPGITGPAFNLTAAPFFLNQPDGEAVYSWGYGCTTAPSGYAPAAITTATCPSAAGMIGQVPGPTLIVTEGQTVTVTLTNGLPTSAGNTSILFPGFTVATSGGVAGLLAQEAAPAGTVTYTFTASSPGTRAYYSGTQGDLQVEMGLYGAIVVLPAHVPSACITGSLRAANLAVEKYRGEADFRLSQAAYDHPSTCYDREYLFQFAEMDQNIHRQAQTQVAATVGCTAGTNGCSLQVPVEPYHPSYFLINGRSMPDDMDANYAAEYPHQPYNGNPHMHPGELTLVRVIGQGHWQHPFHEHANHVRILGRDGNLIVSPTDPNSLAGLLMFTTTTTPGLAFDGLFYFSGKGLNWDMYGHNFADTGVGGSNAAPSCYPDANGYYTVNSTPAAPVSAINYYEWCADHFKPVQVAPFGDVEGGGPVTLPDPNIFTNGAWYGGTPYLGPDATTRAAGPTSDLQPANVQANPANERGFAYMWHSHNEREITTNNVFPGGMLMMMLVDSREFVIDESN